MIYSSSKRQEIKKGSPKPILSINSGLQSNNDEESDLENGSADSVPSLKSDVEKDTIDMNHADENIEKKDDIQTIEVTRRKNKPAKKKEENVYATVDIGHDDGQNLNNLTVPEVAKALVWISY